MDDYENYPEFDLPEGYVLPDGAEAEGDEFTATVTVRLKEGNRACFITLDNAPLGDPKELEEDDEVMPTSDADEMGFAQAMAASMTE